MGDAKTISITMPPELLLKAQLLAEREHRTMSELFREALRRYMLPDLQWPEVLAVTRAKGKALGIRSEADVERAAGEFRKSRASRNGISASRRS